MFEWQPLMLTNSTRVEALGVKFSDDTEVFVYIDFEVDDPTKFLSYQIFHNYTLFTESKSLVTHKTLAELYESLNSIDFTQDAHKIDEQLSNVL